MQGHTPALDLRRHPIRTIRPRPAAAAAIPRAGAVALGPALAAMAERWGTKPTLRTLRDIAALLDGFDACPITLYPGTAGLAAVLPGHMAPGAPQATGYLLLEGPDGHPRGARASIPYGTPFPDAVEMLLLSNLAEPLSREAAHCLLNPFSGWEDRRNGLIAASLAVLAGGEGPATRHATDIVGSRLSSALRRSRLSARFKLGLVADAECEKREDVVFRKDAQGDNARAFLIGYPLPARYTSACSTGKGMASTVRWLGRHASNLTPAHIRRLGGPSAKAWADSCRRRETPYAQAGTLLQFAGGLPVDWMPVGEAQFHAFAACASLVMGLSGTSGQPVKQIAAPSKGDWVSFHASLTRDPALRHVMYHAHAAVEDLAFRVLYPLVGDLVEPDPDPDAALVQVDALRVEDALKGVARQVLYAGKSALGVIEAAKRWQAAVPEIHLRMPYAGGISACWQPLFDPVSAPNGLRVVALDSARALYDEGRADADASGATGLDHCVGTSTVHAAEGYYFYASIRRIAPDGSYERVSTLEIEFAYDGTPARLRQHHGRGNADPHPAAVAAAEWLLKHHPMAPWRAFHQCRTVHGKSNLVGEKCRYDWRRPGFVEAAVAAYGPALPARFSGMDATELRLALDLDAIVIPQLEARRRLRMRYTYGESERTASPGS
jgi:hypothetical protein